MFRIPSIGRISAAAYYGGLRAFGLTAARRRLHDAGTILCYHNVVPDRAQPSGDPGLHMGRDKFERQMCWLLAHYDVVPLTTFIDRLSDGVSMRGTAAVTFDDAYAGVFQEAVPVLRALRLPATVFVVTGASSISDGFWWDHPALHDPDSARRQHWLVTLRGDGAAILAEAGASTHVERAATHAAADWKTIRAHAGDGIDVGVHSATHRSLTTLSDGELHRELIDSRAALHAEIGTWADFLAYPYGLYDERVAAFAQRAGYRAAFGLSSPDDATHNPWRLARLNVPSGISEAAFEAWMAGFRGRRA
jgi:peptidoglycan/xylan/chitin deacetylase (PgdA/CDA1 family)